MNPVTDQKCGELLSLDRGLVSFGHVAASTSGTATFRDIGRDKYTPGIELIVDSTVVPAVGRREVGPDFLQIEFSEPLPLGVASEPRRLTSRIPVWVEGVEAGGLRHLFMTLGSPAIDKKVLSLAEFAPQFWPSSSRKTDPLAKQSELLVLDTVAQILFALAAQLHSRGRTIGLLDPANVLFFFCDKAIQVSDKPVAATGRRPRISVSNQEADQVAVNQPGPPNFAGIQILLPDLFLDADPSVTDVPPWITVRGDYRFLWNTKQIDGDAPGAGEKHYLDRQVKRCSPDNDIKSLARMFAWALTGKKMDYVPADIILRGGCWDVIRSILTPAGQPSGLSAGDAGNSLAVMPLLEHVQPGNSIRDLKKNSLGGKVALWGTLLLLLGFLAFYFLPTEQSPLPPEAMIYVGCLECDRDSRLHKLFTTQLSPLVTQFHGEDRYRFPDDGPAVFEPHSMDAETLSDQTRLLLEQLKVLKDAQAEVADHPAEDAASEQDCMASELRAAIARARQHFDVADGRTVIALDGKLLATDMVRVLRVLANTIKAVNASDICQDVEKTRQFLQTEDPDTRRLFNSDERFAPFFSYAATLCDSDRAKRFLIRHVRQHHLHVLKELEP